MAEISKLANDLTDAFDKFIDALVTSSQTAPVKKQKGDVAADVDESTGQVTLDRDEVEALKIVDLRKLAKEHGIDLKKKAEILDAFEEKGFFADADDEDVEFDADEDEDEDDESYEDEDDEDEEDEEEEEEDDGYDRDDLEDKSLAELKKIAKQEGHTQSDIKGLDQSDLIDLILGEEAEEEDEDEDEDEDDEEVEIDKETLEGMSDAELKEIVKSFSLKVPKKASRKTIIQTILDAAEEDDDE